MYEGSASVAESDAADADGRSDAADCDAGVALHARVAASGSSAAW